MILKLSDSFKIKDNLMIDLMVNVININPSVKHPILEKCKILKEYGIFVETVRKYQQEGNVEAMEQGIGQGKLGHRIKMVKLKLRKGISIPQIISELEEEMEFVKEIQNIMGENYELSEKEIAIEYKNIMIRNKKHIL